MSPYREHKGHATEAYVYCFAVVVRQYNNIVEVSYKECAVNEMPELPTLSLKESHKIINSVLATHSFILYS